MEIDYEMNFGFTRMMIFLKMQSPFFGLRCLSTQVCFWSFVECIKCMETFLFTTIHPVSFLFFDEFETKVMKRNHN